MTDTRMVILAMSPNAAAAFQRKLAQEYPHWGDHELVEKVEKELADQLSLVATPVAQTKAQDIAEQMAAAGAAAVGKDSA